MSVISIQFHGKNSKGNIAELVIPKPIDTEQPRKSELFMIPKKVTNTKFDCAHRDEGGLASLMWPSQWKN